MGACILTLMIYEALTPQRDFPNASRGAAVLRDREPPQQYERDTLKPGFTGRLSAEATLEAAAAFTTT